MDGDTKTRKRSGGQPGKIKPLKHGFYSRQMTALEMDDLDAALSPGLEDDIAMLKVMTRRVFALAQGVEDPELAIKYLRELGTAAVRAAALEKARLALGEAGDSVSTVISQALTEVMAELKITR